MGPCAVQIDCLMEAAVPLLGSTGIRVGWRGRGGELGEAANAGGEAEDGPDGF